MRLIDADALKTIKSIQSADFNSIETIQKWIDDAPTIISATCSAQIKWERDVAIHQLEELGYGFAEKPRRGEWTLETKRILQDDSGDKAIYGNQRFWKCPFCGETVSAGYSKPDYKFCYNCGADMRGGENE